MQGFNMGRHRPYDADPSNQGFNSSQGLHALGKRARKLDQGILIVRFELPFNIWCGSCHAHIGQGVRYNAEKRKVGNYLSTPIYAFRCKCHLCQHWFEIRTDPQNTRYVVEAGARQKNEDIDPDDEGNGSFIADTEGSAPQDAFSALDKRTSQLSRKAELEARLLELEDLASRRNSDPDALNAALRATARPVRKAAHRAARQDSQLRARIGWDDSKELVAETPTSAARDTAAWLDERDQELRRRYTDDPMAAKETRLRRVAPSANSSRSAAAAAAAASRPYPTKRPSPPLPTSNSAAALLAQRLVANSKKRVNPFGLVP